MKIKARIGWLVLALALVGVAGADEKASPPQQQADADPKIPYLQYKLDNGLEVILVQDHTAPIVDVDIWYHVGSGDEVPGKSGYAHLFEHMMFQGAKHIGQDVHFDILRQIGASQINGTTNTDRTNYFEEVPSNQLEVALWLESDRMGYLLDELTDKSLENQKLVVRNERRQSYDNRPYGKELFAVFEQLFPEGHPYRHLTIGLHEDLDKASVADVSKFFRKWYVPSNATLTIAGDFDLDATKQLVDKWFGSFPKTEKPAHRALPDIEVKKTKRVTVEDPFAKLRRVHYAWLTPKEYADGDAELDLVAHALGNPGTGRLYKILVLEKQLAQNVSVYQASALRTSTFNVVVDLKDDADQKVVEQIMNEQLDAVMHDPLTDEEIHRAVVGIEAGFVWGLESLFSRAEMVQHYNHYVGTPDYITQDLDRYRKATPAHVEQIASQYLSPLHRVEVITVPADAASKGDK